MDTLVRRCVDVCIKQRLRSRATRIARGDGLKRRHLQHKLQQVAIVVGDDVVLEQARVLSVSKKVVQCRRLGVLRCMVPRAVLCPLDIAPRQQATRNATPLHGQYTSEGSAGVGKASARSYLSGGHGIGVLR